MYAQKLAAKQGIQATAAESAKLASNCVGQVLNRLREWCGTHWQVSVSRDRGGDTLAEQDQAAESAAYEEAADNPIVRAALEAFPGARIERVTSREVVTEEPLADDVPIETEDDE